MPRKKIEDEEMLNEEARQRLDELIRDAEHQKWVISMRLKKLRAARSAYDDASGNHADSGQPKPLIAKSAAKATKRSGPTDRGASLRGKDNFGHIAAFIKTQGAPQTMKQLVTGTGISRGSVAAVVYRTHADQFTTHDGPGTGKRTAFGLKDE